MQFFLSAENVLRAQHMYALMKRSSHVLIVSHRKPDGDTISSALVCYDVLAQLGAQSVLFCTDSVPAVFSYLPDSEKYTHDATELKDYFFDLIIVVDSGDLEHTGIAETLTSLMKKGARCISFDHHATHTGFGDINLVDDGASSTVEVLFSFLRVNKFPLHKKNALLLLTGLITDTYTFSNPATNYVATSVAADLVCMGVPLYSLVQQIRSEVTVEVLNIWGEIMSALVYNERLGCITAVIDRNLLNKYGASDAVVDGFANFLGHYSDASFIMVLRDGGDGYVKGSLRTSHDTVDVARLAQALGGGGHRKAAGFTIPGVLQRHSHGWRVTLQ